MTLTRLLEIKMELLRYEDKQGLHLAERLWSESGEPIEPQALCKTLDAILNVYMERGIWFPKIPLARKKQLQCGTWKPHVSTDTTQRIPASAQIGSECAELCGNRTCCKTGGRVGFFVYTVRSLETKLFQHLRKNSVELLTLRLARVVRGELGQ